MWSERGFEPLTVEKVQINGHAALGMTTFILSTIYPFVSLLRPHPFEAKFKLFNILYQVLWYFILCIALTAMGLASNFSSLDFGDGKYLLINFVAFYVAFQTMLFFYTKYVGQNRKVINCFLSLYLSGSIVTTCAMIAFIVD